MPAGTSAGGRVPGVDRRGFAGWSSAAQRPPTSEVPHLLLLIWTTSSPRWGRPYAPWQGLVENPDTGQYGSVLGRSSEVVEPTEL